MCAHDRGVQVSMCVQHPHELVLVPCPLFTWTRKPQKADPTMRVCVQVANFGKWFKGTGLGDWKKGNREGGKANPRCVTKLVLLCGQWAQALWNPLWSCPGCASEWSTLRGSPYLAGLQPLLFSPSSGFRMADYIAMGGSLARVGKSGGRRERYTAGRKGAWAAGCPDGGIKDRQRGCETSDTFFYQNVLFCCWDPNPVLLANASSIHWRPQVGTWWVLSKLRELFGTFLS